MSSWKAFIGCVVFIVVYFGFLTSLAISNADIRTNHTLNINADNESVEIMHIMDKMVERTEKAGYFYWENRILNESIKYRLQIKDLENDIVMLKSGLYHCGES